MQSGGGIGVAVPDDQDLGPTGSGTSSSLTPQPPWQSIPKFIPGTTNVQEYTQKLKFLAAMWPSEHLEQLAPRAALLVEGSAFKKVARLDPAKLKVPNQTGIALLVDAIGGSWGSTELEERYEYFEKSIYGTVQRADESHDSYLARMEANFVELISRGTTLEEVQAHCREHVAGYKIPRQITIEETVSRMPSGKPDYRWAEEVALAHNVSR